jgi:hypothetical protein
MPCGCIIITENAHVTDIIRCAACDKHWQASLDKYVDEIDKWIEEQVFNDNS